MKHNAKCCLVNTFNNGIDCTMNNVISLPVAADCPEPTVPPYGTLIGLQRKNGDTIRFECDVGYELVGQGYAICESGAWNSPSPSCNCKYLMLHELYDKHRKVSPLIKVNQNTNMK